MQVCFSIMAVVGVFDDSLDGSLVEVVLQLLLGSNSGSSVSVK